MVNTLGIKKADVLRALEAEAGHVFSRLEVYKPIVWRPNSFAAYIDGCLVVLDLFADDGFDETDYDKALGPGAAQRAIDKLRMSRHV